MKKYVRVITQEKPDTGETVYAVVADGKVIHRESDEGKLLIWITENGYTLRTPGNSEWSTIRIKVSRRNEVREFCRQHNIKISTFIARLIDLALTGQINWRR